MATEDKFTYTCEVSQSQNKDGTKSGTRQLSITMDFTGVTRSQLITEATRNIVVKLQGKMRSATVRKEKPLSWDAAVKEFNGQTIEVGKFLAEGRNRSTPQERAVKLAAAAKKQDPETTRLLIEELQRSLAGKPAARILRK